jgi:hypothetical protein
MHVVMWDDDAPHGHVGTLSLDGGTKEGLAGFHIVSCADSHVRVLGC